MHKRITKAFTLIELLVVIAIIGILTGFIFVSMNGAVNSAKDAKRKADLSTISKAILEYMTVNNNAYPYTASTSTCNLCNNDSCTNPCTGFYANIQPYLSNIPLDPNGSTYYTYTYSATPKFVLQANLSNAYAYQYDSTAGFSILSYSSTCTAATNTQVQCTAITISSTEEACKCTYLSGAGTTTWSAPNGVIQVQYLVIGGGGGGGAAPPSGYIGGGGGGGGYRTGTGFAVTTSTPYTVTVGVGGNGGVGTTGAKGGDSVFSTITSTGGGLGGYGSASISNGGTGGSGGGGGGGNVSSVGGTGNTPSTSPIQGTNGAAGASGGSGGGGGGSAGAASGYTPGTGTSNSISGSAVTYAAGGAGNGIQTIGVKPADKTAGSGDGGTGGWNTSGGAGGSGVVIIRYTHP